jgi:predicted RNA-binding protein associated with RNAse of E/G family
MHMSKRRGGKRKNQRFKSLEKNIGGLRSTAPTLPDSLITIILEVIVMVMESRFIPRQTIVIRDIVRGNIWAARPFLVIQDTPELLALYMPTGTICRHGASANGGRPVFSDLSRGNWILREEVWLGGDRVRLTVPGKKYSILLFWNPDGSLNRWYINLEEPLSRTNLGFDLQDKVLDVILTPDMTSWRWEDEDELAEAVAAGLMSNEEALEFRGVGIDAVNLLQSGKSIFNGWEKWRPDPSWAVPVLPAGWDKVNNGF